MTNLRQNKDVRVFVFNTFNALITLLVTYVTGSEYSILLVPVINFVTKYINTKYFGDIGVSTPSA